MLIQANEFKSLLIDDIVLILNKDCIMSSNKEDLLNNIELDESIDYDRDDIKTFIIAREKNNDKEISYRMYSSTKSSLSLINKYNKLEE